MKYIGAIALASVLASVILLAHASLGGEVRFLNTAGDCPYKNMNGVCQKRSPLGFMTFSIS